MEINAVTGLCVVAFLLGRAYQKWSSGTLNAEDEIYSEGYDEGYREGLQAGRGQGWARGWHQGQVDAKQHVQ